MPATGLVRALISSEVTYGTPVVPAARLMGVTGWTPRIANEDIQVEEIGIMAPSKHTALVGHSAGLDLAIALSYEEILWVLNAMDTALITGTNPYTHSFVMPVQLAGVFKSYTLMLDHGDITTEWQVEGAIAQNLVITGAEKDVWRATQTYIGKKMTRTSLTALPADRTIELIKTADTQLWVDLEAAAFGTTEITETFRGFTATLNTARHLKWLTNSIYPSGYGVGPWTGTLEIKMEVNATVLNWIELLLTTEVKRAIRIKATSGAKSARLDFAGKLIAAPLDLYEDDGGNLVINTLWQGSYNTTMGNWFESVVVNTVPTLPA